MIQLFPAQFLPQNTPILDQKGNFTTAAMGYFRAIFNRTGQGTGNPIVVSSLAASAAAPALSADWNWITSGNGKVTLAALVQGQRQVVFNAIGSTLTINAPAGATIDGASSYSLAASKMQIFWWQSMSVINSTQLG